MNPKPERIDAAYALVGGGIAVIEEKLVYLDKQTPPTDSAIDAELKKLQDEYDAQAYGRARQPLYPDLGDQLDDLHHKGAFSTEMAAKIKKVKDDNPKPE